MAALLILVLSGSEKLFLKYTVPGFGAFESVDQTQFKSFKLKFIKGITSALMITVKRKTIKKIFFII